MQQKVVSFSSFCMFLLGQIKTVEQQKETFQISFYNELFSINTEITFVLKKSAGIFKNWNNGRVESYSGKRQSPQNFRSLSLADLQE